MDDFARDTHVLVEETTYRQKDVSGRTLSELLLDASVSGDYYSIVNFLNRLQRSKNVYIVDSLAVDTAESARGPNGALRVSLHIRTYFRKA